MLKVYDRTTKKEIRKGDTITDFRGEKSTFQCATRAKTKGKSGKVCNEYGEYYDNVFNLIVIEE